LLNGGALPEVRTASTLEALAQLEQVGCLTNQERMLLWKNYSFLRKVEHRLQSCSICRRISCRNPTWNYENLPCAWIYTDSEDSPALISFMNDYRNKTQLNRKILGPLAARRIRR